MAHEAEIHVVFGTGPLGMAVIRELHQQGIPVRVVNRSGLADLPAGVEIRAADAYHTEEARNAAQGLIARTGTGSPLGEDAADACLQCIVHAASLARAAFRDCVDISSIGLVCAATTASGKAPAQTNRQARS
ncbi:MAG: hypothetical protein ACK2UW_09520 [Anaerolineales bacterium]